MENLLASNNLGCCHKGHAYTKVRKNGWKRCLICVRLTNQLRIRQRRQAGIPWWLAEGRSYAAYVQRCQKQTVHARLTGYGKRAQARYREKLRHLYGGSDLRTIAVRIRFLLKTVDIK